MMWRATSARPQRQDSDSGSESGCESGGDTDGSGSIVGAEYVARPNEFKMGFVNGLPGGDHVHRGALVEVDDVDSWDVDALLAEVDALGIS
jgi:hypothetical protein